MTPKTRNFTLAGAALAAVVTAATFLSTTGPTQVPVGENLQAYIDRASPGDTLQLADGATHTGNFVVNKSLRIESIGTRPVQAAFGVTFNVGAKIMSVNAAPAVYVPPGVAGVTFDGVEITHQGFIYDVVKVGSQGPDQDTHEEAPRDITFNNVWIHGTATDHSQNGLVANGVNVKALNSRIDEIHGIGVESHGIIAYNGPGPFQFSGSFISAAGINVMFGGAVPSIPGLLPKGEVRGNHLFKPLSWKVGHPTYAGIHWSVKNLIEFKTGENITVDGNLMENSWLDAQIGYAVLFTVRGENGKAPWHTIRNAAFTNNIVRNSDHGIQLMGIDDGGASVRASGLLVRNNLFENITGRWLTMTGYENATFEHNTHWQQGNITALYGEPSPGFVYRNNLTLRAAGSFGIFGDGAGEGNAAIAKYLPGSVILGNVIVGANANSYPANNFYPTDLNGLANLKGTDGLTPGYSPQLTTASPSPSVTATVTVSPSPTVSPVVSPSATPPTLPGEASPDKTRIPTATKIVDDAGATWTLNGNQMLRNGQGTGGFGSALQWCTRKIYGLGEDSQWYQWMGDGWMRVGGDPCGVAASPSATATPIPSPTAAPTSTPTPQPTPSPVVSPSPLPFCRSGERPGNPPRCRCRKGFQGTSGKCR